LQTFKGYPCKGRGADGVKDEQPKWSMNYSFTQPYYGYPNQWNEAYHRLMDVQRQLEKLDAIDSVVQNMLTYPDAEAILNKIREESKHD
jgi:hypothetical protein